MKLHLNFEAYKHKFGKADAERIYKQEKKALQRVEVTEDEVKEMLNITDAKVFLCTKEGITKILEVASNGYKGSISKYSEGWIDPMYRKE